MGINFPPSPTPDQLHPTPAVAGLPQYRWDATTGAWVTNTPQDALSYVRRSGDTMTGALVLPADPTAALQSATKQYVDSRDNIRDVRRNRIVNGAMQVSQEYGDALITIAAASFWRFPADQFGMSINSSATFTLTTQRVEVTTPKGSLHRIRTIVTTAQTTVAGYAMMGQEMEGIHVADLMWGTAAAKPIIFRFGWRSPAGTYSVSLRNAATDRSYVATFIVTAGQANTDTEQTIVIPGETTGTWDRRTGLCMYINWVMASSIGITPTNNAWTNTTTFTAIGQTNGVATLNNTFELFDVGLYLDVDNTGIAPKWEMPDPVEELAGCQRYWNKIFGLLIMGYSPSSSGSWYHSTPFPNVMRVAPTATPINTSYSNASGLALNYASSSSVRTTVTGTAVGAFYSVYDIVLNARM